MRRPLHTSRLLRYDFSIIVSEFGTAFSAWKDRALLAIMVLLAVAVFQSVATSAGKERIVLSAVVIGAVAGATVQHTLQARLRFFAAETMLAAEALTASSVRLYLLLPHIAAVGMLALAALFLRAVAAPFLIGGYALGASILWVSDKGSRRLSRALASLAPKSVSVTDVWRRHPLVGTAGAVSATGMYFALRSTVTESVALASLGICTAITLYVTGRVNDAEARFDAFAGRTPGESVRTNARSSLVLLAIQLTLTVLLSNSAIALTALLGTLALALLAARTCLYRLHSKRMADFILAAFVALLAMFAQTVPIFAPVLAAVAASFLWRQSSAAAWLMRS